MQEALGPSPLAQAASAIRRMISPPPGAEEQTSPTGYVPPPVLDSTVGNPGAFTDDPDILPQTQTVVDPYAVPPPEEEPVAVNPVERSSSEAIFAPVMAESMKSAGRLQSMRQEQTNTAPGFSTAVMPPNFPHPNYNVWASGSTQDGDNRHLLCP
jgi:hypothetical protein